MIFLTSRLLHHLSGRIFFSSFPYLFRSTTRPSRLTSDCSFLLLSNTADILSQLSRSTPLVFSHTSHCQVFLSTNSFRKTRGEYLPAWLSTNLLSILKFSMPIVGKLAKAEAKQARNYMGLGAVLYTLRVYVVLD